MSLGFRHAILNSKTVNVGDIRMMIVTDIHLKAGVEDLPEAEGAINVGLSRYYYASPNLMEQFVAEVNLQNPDVVLCLGDMCDMPEDFVRWNELWGAINPGIKKYIVPGNHDLDVLTFNQLLTTLGMENEPIVAGSQFNKVVKLNDNAILILADVTFDASDNHTTAYMNMRMHSTGPAWIETTLANYSQNNVIIALHCAPQVSEYFQTQSSQLYAIIDAAKLARPELNVTWICGHYHVEALQIDDTTHANSTALIMPAMILWENGRYVSMTVNVDVSYNQSFIDYEFGEPVLPMVWEIDTTKGNGLSNFKFPFSISAQMNHDMMVEWGDGQFDYVHGTAANLNVATLIHPYAVAGVYDIKIYGKCEAIYFNNLANSDRLKLTKLKQWGNIKWKSLNGGFWGCSNITEIPNGPITGKAIDIVFETETVQSLLRGLTSVNQPIPSNLLSQLQGVTHLNTFFASSNFNGQIPVSLFYGLSSIISLFRTFHLCTKLTNTIPGLLFRDLINLETAYGTFDGASLITGLESGLYDYSPALYNLADAHRNQIGLTGSIPNNFFVNCPLVTTYSRTFQGTRNLIVGNLFDLTKLGIVTNFSEFINPQNTGYSPTGTVQDIWNYATHPSLITDYAFRYATGLTNYADIPNDWKGV